MVYMWYISGIRFIAWYMGVILVVHGVFRGVL